MGAEEGLLNTMALGDLEGARTSLRSAASRIDAHLLGSAVLARVTDWCRCRSPFDLEAVPDFARPVAEAGLAWPPPAIIRLPAKDWQARIVHKYLNWWGMLSRAGTLHEKTKTYNGRPVQGRPVDIR